MPPLVIFWFRRDLRVHDNRGLDAALRSGFPVLPLFVFDRHILDPLPDRDDARVGFIHAAVGAMDEKLRAAGSSLLALYATPEAAFDQLLETYAVQAVYANEDYEPYATHRDAGIEQLLAVKRIPFHRSKDAVLFARNEVVKPNGEPYAIFTPYYNRWIAALSEGQWGAAKSEERMDAFWKGNAPPLPTLQSMGFVESPLPLPLASIDADIIRSYHHTRDTPSVVGTTRLGLHLRFGTVGVRETVRAALTLNDVFVKELAWRDFFLQMIWRLPRLATQAYKTEYDRIPWRNNAEDFERWCAGATGYPLVDAGMRELAATGTMHNRVRMIAASFLVKHLLIDWRWGEGYFARKLLDYELASNVGNWQWVAGCGCDAAPYFRVFNPATQAARWDKSGIYIRKWVPEFDSMDYAPPMVDHAMAVERCKRVYREALKG